MIRRSCLDPPPEVVWRFALVIARLGIDMTDDNDDRYRRAVEMAERLAPMLPGARAASLLSSPAVADRLEGIRLARHEGLEELIPRLRELLADDAPYVFRRGSRRFVSEIRVDALLALEDLYRLGHRAVDLGPVHIRRAMRADEAIAAAERVLAACPEPDRARALAAADEAVDPRVKPSRDGDDAIRAYRELQTLGRIDYELQEVDPTTYLTPLQAELYREQVATPPAPPYLEIATTGEPQHVLGFVYRDGGDTGSWIYQFAESPEAERAQAYLATVLSIESAGIPRVVRDSDGNPRTHDDGSFVLDGVVPADGGDTLAYLDSVAAFMSRRYGARAHVPGRDRPAGSAPAASEAAPATRTSGTYVRYLFIWDPRAGEVVASYYIHRDDQPEQVATDVSGGAIPAAQEQERLAELRTRFPTDRYTYGGGWASSLKSCVEGFLGMEKE